MARVRVTACVRGFGGREALERVTDYRLWPAASDAVRGVRVEGEDRARSVSYWEVAFRGGVMRWSERDRLDLAAGRETFELIEGDPHRWRGGWRVLRSGSSSCEIEMDAEFDLGMPSLSQVLDPIAVEALEDTVASVVRGLFGEGAPVRFGEREQSAIERADADRRGARSWQRAEEQDDHDYATIE